MWLGVFLGYLGTGMVITFSVVTLLYVLLAVVTLPVKLFDWIKEQDAEATRKREAAKMEVDGKKLLAWVSDAGKRGYMFKPGDLGRNK